MLEIKYKHYIRINSNNEIIHAFSDAFEQPEKTDILLKETEERHCQFQVMSDKYIGKYKYKYVDGEIIEKTEEELYTAEERKADKIKQINNKAKADIEAVYPLWEQINLIGGYDKEKDTEKKKENMIDYINSVRKKADEEIKLLKE
jgi:hypothetical protein